MLNVKSNFVRIKFLKDNEEFCVWAVYKKIEDLHCFYEVDRKGNKLNRFFHLTDKEIVWIKEAKQNFFSGFLEYVN